MDKKPETWTKRRANEELGAVLGDRRAIWVSCYKGTSGLYYASVWEDPIDPDAPGSAPMHLGFGINLDRSEAIRRAKDAALDNLSYAGQEDAEQLAVHWLYGNRKDVLRTLRSMPGPVAAAAALTVAYRLPEDERTLFVATVLDRSDEMAPQPQPVGLRKRAEPQVVEDHCPECEQPESECVCDQHEVCPVPLG